MTELPNLVGWRAVILHRADDNTERLVRQLGLLGLSAHVQWQPLDTDRTPADIVLVDADRGWPGLLAWGEAVEASVPVVALLQSEAPGRVAWALEQGAGAFLAKPVAASAVYPALVLAACVHRERIEGRLQRAMLEDRIRMRPLVHGAVRAIMCGQHLDEDAAYRALRFDAMSRRIAMEQAAAEILAGRTALPEAG
jgi:AmiR/NasT family two-component response regulator